MAKPTFDTWTIVFLFTAIQGIFVSAVLLARNEAHPSRKVLATITILFSIILIEYVLYWTGYQFYYPYLAAVATPLFYLFAPLFFIYFKSMFNKSGLNKIDLIHLLPFVLVFAWFSPFIFKAVADKQYILLHGSKNKNHLILTFIVWANVVQMFSYLYLIHRNFWALSQSDHEVNKWFKWLIGFFIGFMTAYISYFILVNFTFFNAAWDYGISFCMMFFIFFIAWFGYMQPKVFCGFAMFEQQKIKYKNSPISADFGKEIIAELQRKMLEKKYFLSSDLSLEKLAILTNTNKHYLSQAINETLKMNFFEYINTLRVNEAKQLLKSQQNTTIIEIAYMIGYNNKVSFNKAFKNIVGVTPSQYRNA